MSDELFKQVQATVAQTLKISESEVMRDSSADTLAAWDSLAQVNLVMSLESAFDLELDVDEFMELTSVAAIVEYLEANRSA
jgi:acyl carrier protein